MTICYRVVTEAAYRARRARHIGHGIARHLTQHLVAAVVSVVCVAAPAALWASLPPSAPAIYAAPPAGVYAPGLPDWWSSALPDVAPVLPPQPTDVPAPAMGWIVLLPLALRWWRK